MQPDSKSTNDGEDSGGAGSLLRAARGGNIERLIALLEDDKVDINTCNSSGLNCLHLASKEGHVDVVTELINRNIPINQPTKRGNTALHIASLAGKLDIVKVLIENGADSNAMAQNAFTPLYMASQEGHEEIVDFLLKSGSNQSISTEDGFTPLAVALQEGKDKVVALLLDNDVKGRVKLPALHIAARKDDVKAAALLLQNDHSAEVTSKMMVNRTTESGFTALHIAAHYGNINVASLLLNRGASIDFAARNGITPLHVACKRGHTRFCALLLERGANLQAQTKDGLAPLHCAARSGHEPVVQLILKKADATEISRTKNGLSALHMAAQGGHVEVVELLLKHEFPVDDATLDYLTALHIAAHCGHEEVATMLLNWKAKVDNQAMNGFTPLHVACKKNKINIVKLLLKHGANTEATTESGLTTLHVACFMGHFEIVKILLGRGAALDTVNTRGETALHMATRSGKEEIVEFLLENGAKPDTRKKEWDGIYLEESQTALHLAARLDKLSIAKILLQHGAVADEIMRDGYTPLHVAAKEGHVEICELLLDKGASVSLTTKKGFTPLHLAAKYGRLEVSSLLLKKYASADAIGKDGLTPLHVAAHYDNQNVALLLLKHGASPHAPAKNGYTALHIAAKKNQIDIAVTLLEYGASANCKTRMEATPLHLASQAGNTDMCNLLLAKDANVNAAAKHGLSPMHLAGTEDRVAVAKILYDNGSLVDPLTKGGYTPLLVASHHGHIKMVEYLLSLEAKVNAKTKTGYTALHLAAQQGHTQIVDILLKFGASPNELTNNGNTALSLAKRLGYITVVDTLTTVTTEVSECTVEEKHKLNIPETFNEGFLSDASDDDDDDGIPGESSYLTGKELQELGDDSIMPTDAAVFMSGRDSRYSTMDNFPGNRMSWESMSEVDNKNMIDRKVSGFLVSFMVDARGGTRCGSRHPDLRVIVPPNACAAPTRVTCRLARRHNLTRSSASAMSGGLPLLESESKAARVLELSGKGSSFLDKLHFPTRTPVFNEGEFLASRILQLDPKCNALNGPIAIEIPHFANLRGNEREIIIIRSDDGESWKEHRNNLSDKIFLERLEKIHDLESADKLAQRRVIRVITDDLPRYFALVSRCCEDICQVGPKGGVLESTVNSRARATFPKDALMKEIKVGIQIRPIPLELTKRAVGGKAKASAIVTVEPRRRKFHKPINLAIPLPEGSKMQDYLSSTEDSTLRLLCSISGGTDPAQWEDITGSTPLTFHEDAVTFTTTVSAKFWLLDCQHTSESTTLAESIYTEAMQVPFMVKFIVLAKRTDVSEAQLRVFCITDDKYEGSLESQEHYAEIACSRDLEVLNRSPVYIECSGNLTISKQSQPSCIFQPFKENRMHFNVNVRDMSQEPCGRLSFYRDPRGSKKCGARKPLCSLNISLPHCEKSDSDEEFAQTPSKNEETPAETSATFNAMKARERYYLVDPSSVDIFDRDDDSTPEEIAKDVSEVMDKLIKVKEILSPTQISRQSVPDDSSSEVAGGLPRSASMEETTQVVTEVRDSLAIVKDILESDGDEEVLQRECSQQKQLDDEEHINISVHVRDLKKAFEKKTVSEKHVPVTDISDDREKHVVAISKITSKLKNLSEKIDTEIEKPIRQKLVDREDYKTKKGSVTKVVERENILDGLSSFMEKDLHHIEHREEMIDAKERIVDEHVTSSNQDNLQKNFKQTWDADSLAEFLACDFAKETVNYTTAVYGHTQCEKLESKDPEKLVRFDDNIIVLHHETVQSSWSDNLLQSPSSDDKQKKSVSQRIKAYEEARHQLDIEVEKFRQIASLESEMLHQKAQLEAISGEIARANESEEKETSPVVIEETHTMQELLRTWEKSPEKVARSFQSSWQKKDSSEVEHPNVSYEKKVLSRYEDHVLQETIPKLEAKTLDEIQLHEKDLSSEEDESQSSDECSLSSEESKSIDDDENVSQLDTQFPVDNIDDSNMHLSELCLKDETSTMILTSIDTSYKDSDNDIFRYNDGNPQVSKNNNTVKGKEILTPHPTPTSEVSEESYGDQHKMEDSSDSSSESDEAAYELREMGISEQATEYTIPAKVVTDAAVASQLPLENDQTTQIAKESEELALEAEDTHYLQCHGALLDVAEGKFSKDENPNDESKSTYISIPKLKFSSSEEFYCDPNSKDIGFDLSPMKEKFLGVDSEVDVENIELNLAKDNVLSSSFHAQSAEYQAVLKTSSVEQDKMSREVYIPESLEQNSSTPGMLDEELIAFEKDELDVFAMMHRDDESEKREDEDIVLKKLNLSFQTDSYEEDELNLQEIQESSVLSETKFENVLAQDNIQSRENVETKPEVPKSESSQPWDEFELEWSRVARNNHFQATIVDSDNKKQIFTETNDADEKICVIESHHKQIMDSTNFETTKNTPCVSLEKVDEIRTKETTVNIPTSTLWYENILSDNANAGLENVLPESVQHVPVLKEHTTDITGFSAMKETASLKQDESPSAVGLHGNNVQDEWDRESEELHQIHSHVHKHDDLHDFRLTEDAYDDQNYETQFIEEKYTEDTQIDECLAREAHDSSFPTEDDSCIPGIVANEESSSKNIVFSTDDPTISSQEVKPLNSEKSDDPLIQEVDFQPEVDPDLHLKYAGDYISVGDTLQHERESLFDSLEDLHQFKACTALETQDPHPNEIVHGIKTNQHHHECTDLYLAQESSANIIQSSLVSHYINPIYTGSVDSDDTEDTIEKKNVEETEGLFTSDVSYSGDSSNSFQQADDDNGYDKTVDQGKLEKHQNTKIQSFEASPDHIVLKGGTYCESEEGYRTSGDFSDSILMHDTKTATRESKLAQGHKDEIETEMILTRSREENVPDGTKLSSAILSINDTEEGLSEATVVPEQDDEWDAGTLRGDVASTEHVTEEHGIEHREELLCDYNTNILVEEVISTTENELNMEIQMEYAIDKMAEDITNDALSQATAVSTSDTESHTDSDPDDNSSDSDDESSTTSEEDYVVHHHSPSRKAPGPQCSFDTSYDSLWEKSQLRAMKSKEEDSIKSMEAELNRIFNKEIGIRQDAEVASVESAFNVIKHPYHFNKSTRSLQEEVNEISCQLGTQKQPAAILSQPDNTALSFELSSENKLNVDILHQDVSNKFKTDLKEEERGEVESGKVLCIADTDDLLSLTEGVSDTVASTEYNRFYTSQQSPLCPSAPEEHLLQDDSPELYGGNSSFNDSYHEEERLENKVKEHSTHSTNPFCTEMILPEEATITQRDNKNDVKDGEDLFTSVPISVNSRDLTNFAERNALSLDKAMSFDDEGDSSLRSSNLSSSSFDIEDSDDEELAKLMKEAQMEAEAIQLSNEEMYMVDSSFLQSQTIPYPSEISATFHDKSSEHISENTKTDGILVTEAGCGYSGTEACDVICGSANSVSGNTSISWLEHSKGVPTSKLLKDEEDLEKESTCISLPESELKFPDCKVEPTVCDFTSGNSPSEQEQHGNSSSLDDFHSFKMMQSPMIKSKNIACNKESAYEEFQNPFVSVVTQQTHVYETPPSSISSVTGEDMNEMTLEHGLENKAFFQQEMISSDDFQTSSRDTERLQSAKQSSLEIRPLSPVPPQEIPPPASSEQVSENDSVIERMEDIYPENLKLHFAQCIDMHTAIENAHHLEIHSWSEKYSDIDETSYEDGKHLFSQHPKPEYREDEQKFCQLKSNELHSERSAKSKIPVAKSNTLPRNYKAFPKAGSGIGYSDEKIRSVEETERNITVKKHSRIPVRRSVSQPIVMKTKKAGKGMANSSRKQKSPSMSRSSSGESMSSKRSQTSSPSNVRLWFNSGLDSTTSAGDKYIELRNGVYTYKSSPEEELKSKLLKTGKGRTDVYRSSDGVTGLSDTKRDSVASIVFSSEETKSSDFLSFGKKPHQTSQVPFALDVSSDRLQYDKRAKSQKSVVTGYQDTVTLVKSPIHNIPTSNVPIERRTEELQAISMVSRGGVEEVLEFTSTVPLRSSGINRNYAKDTNHFLSKGLGLHSVELGVDPGVNKEAYLDDEEDIEQEVDMESDSDTSSEDSLEKNDFAKQSFRNEDAKIHAISSQIGLKWMQLAKELNVSDEDIWQIQKACADAEPSEKSFCMLLLWHENNKQRTDKDETLKRALQKIECGDIADKIEIEGGLDNSVASEKNLYDVSGFNALAAELGSPNPLSPHISSPYPFRTENTSSPLAHKSPDNRKKTENPAPLYSAGSDADDPDKPHFIYMGNQEAPATPQKMSDEVFQSDTNKSPGGINDLDAADLQDVVDSKKEEERDCSDTESKAKVVQEVMASQITSTEMRTRDGVNEVNTTTITRTLVIDANQADDTDFPETVVRVDGDTEDGNIQVTRQIVKHIVEEDNSSESSSSYSDEEE